MTAVGLRDARRFVSRHASDLRSSDHHPFSQHESKMDTEYGNVETIIVIYAERY